MIARRRRRSGALVVAALLLAVGTLPATAPAEQVPAKFFGMAPSGATPTLVELQRMAEGGVRLLRYSLSWRSIEPSRPDLLSENPVSETLRWREMDQLVGNAAMNRIKVLPTVTSSPSWVSGLPEEPPLDSGADRNAWQRFLRSAVRRYGPDGEFWDLFALLNPGVKAMPITDWQIWNEQNGRNHWFPKPSPKEYAQLLRLSSEAIRGIDHKAQIVLGGMFGTPNGGAKPSIYSWKFLRGLYKAGADRHFDAVAAHPYSPSMRGIKAQMNLLRDEMIEAGDAATPMWVTEIGWDTSDLRRGPRVPSATEAAQASKVRRALQLLVARRSKWNVPAVTWFSWRDSDGDRRCNSCHSAGLFRGDLTPKPAWYEFVNITGGRP